MAEFLQDIWEHVSVSFLNKKWISASAVADLGNAQAIAVAPTRRNFIAFQVGPSDLLNRSGATAVLGLGVRYRTATWEAGQLTAAGAYTANTGPAQDATTGDFQLHDRTTSGSGFLVAADERFNTVSLVQSAAGDQTNPVQVLEYWNGTSWVDITATALINDALDANGTGEKVLNFPVPPDWAPGGSGSGVPQTRYGLRVRQTISAAGAANPMASQLFVGLCKMELVGVSSGDPVSLIRESPLRFPRSGEALFPLTNQPSANNIASVSYQFYA